MNESSPARSATGAARRRSAIARYALAAGAAGLAAALRAALDPVLGDDTPWIVSFPVALIAAALWGVGPALLAIAVCGVLGAVRYYGLLESGFTAAQAASFVVFLVSSAVIVGFATMLRRERSRAATLEELLESRLGEHRAVLDLIPAGVVIARNPEVTEIIPDRVAAELFGVHEGVNIARAHPDGDKLPFRVKRDGEDVPPDKLPMIQAVRERTTVRAEMEIHSETVGVRHLHVVAAPHFDEEGHVRGAVAAFNDVSDRVRIEAALAESEARFRLAAEAMSGLVYEWDVRTDRVWRSSKLKSLLGYSPEEAAPHADWWRRRVHPEDLPRITAAYEQCVRSRAEICAVECRMLHRDGHYVWIWDQGRILYDDSGSVMRLLGCAFSIDARKRAEAELAAERDFLDKLINAAPVSVAVLEGEELRYVMVNRTYAQLAPPGKEFVGSRFGEVNPGPESEVMKQAMRAALRDGNPRSVRELAAKSRGGQASWWRTELVPLGKRHPDRLLVIAGDVTDLVQARTLLERHQERLEALVAERTAELQRSQQALRVAERMAALGSFSAGLGHDLRNVLAPMRLWVDALDASDRLAPELAEHVRCIREASKYLQGLTAGLRSLSLDPDDADASPGRTDIARWWEEISGLLRSQVPRTYHLAAENLGGLPPVSMPRHALTQVVFNLVQNAADALHGRPRGRILITAERRDDHVELAVRDDGPGMTPDVLERCVEPFFTTKEKGRGTGLGLSIVVNTMRRYGGEVRLESAPGAGAAFFLKLPLAPSERGAAHQAVVSIAEPRTAALVRAMLESAGFRLLAWENPRPPDAQLWVIDENVDDDAVHAFLRANAHPRAAVCLGPRAAAPGLVVIETPGNIARLRAAIDAARRSLNGPGPGEIAPEEARSERSFI